MPLKAVTYGVMRFAWRLIACSFLVVTHVLVACWQLLVIVLFNLDKVMLLALAVTVFMILRMCIVTIGSIQ